MNSHLSKYLTRPVPKLPSEISLRRRVRDDFTNEFTYKPLPIFDKRTETTEFSDHARYAKVKRFEEVLNHVSEKKPLELEPADLEPEPEPEQEQEPEPEPIVEHAVLEPLPRKKAVPIRRVRDEFTHPFREIDANWKKGLPKKTPLEKLVTKASSYYMSNRKQFTAKLLALFRKFSKKEKEPVSCQNENAKDTWIPLIHQQLVREYLNLYTPYRGLLLYHGLGSGKTCASIAIAEAAKSEKRVFIMTPASLKSNFFAELKKCADPLYKQNQYWQFVSTEGREPQFVREISKALSVPWELVEKHRGVWLMDVRKHTPNFGFLDAAQQHQLSAQLDAMIREKYVDIHYNGLNGKKMDELIAKYGTGEDGNPFHDSVIIVDEAHNLVSRIVNKLETPDGNGISMRLYNWLQEAQNARIVFLSGTPVVNFANEMAVMFNMLRGKIATWTFKLENAAQLNGETLLQLFAKHNFQTFDYIDYSDGILKITRNPFGFVNVYTPQEAPQEVVEGGLRTQKTAKKQPLKGSRQTRKPRKNGPVIVPAMKFKKNKGALELPPVEEIDLSEHIKEQIAFELHQQQNGFGEEDPNHSGGAPVTAPNYLGVKKDENGNIDDRTFVKTIQRIFREEGIGLAEKQPTVTYFQCLPDNKTVFEEQFVDVAQQTVKSSTKDTLKKRILGLASYFRSAQESLLPETVHPDGDKSKQYFIEAIPMSDHQWKQYLEKRQIEINMEMNAMRQKKEDRISVYRTFTRAACNFVFPEDIKHPKAALRKRTDEPTEDDFVGAQEDQDTDTDTQDSEEIRAAFNLLAQEPHRLRGEPLMELSPKFHRLLENLQHPEHDGLHMVYSAFRTVEGIGALKVVLEANGFEEFKLERTGNGGWQIANFDVQSKKPRFALHTGTESPEEKTVLRNIFNSHWENIPHNLAQQLQTLHGNNFFGEIVKVIMITASGAEGINLENTRFVHIVEPYWHGVRLEQVVGRARRICSHQRLPEDKRTVQTFMYLATFSEDQLQSRDNWRTVYDADLPKDENGKKEERPITTDEFLLRIMLRKDKLNQSLLQCIQESSIDCAVHDNELECFSFGQTNKKTKTEFGTHPDIQEDLDVVEEGKETKRAKVKEVWIDAKPYAWNAETDELYDFHKYSAKRKVVDVVGTLEDKRQEKAEILQKNLIKYQFIFNDGSQEPLTLVYSKDTDKLYSYSDGIHAKPLRYYLNKADNHEIEIKSKKI